MIQALALIFLPIGMALVIFLETFNGLNHGSAVTVVGGSLSLFLGIMLYYTRVSEMKFYVEKIKRAENIVLLSCACVFLYLGYVTAVYGYSPTLLFFMDGYVPPELQYGRYRALMPLRSLLPPLIVAQTVFVFMILPCRSAIKSYLVRVLSFFSLLSLSVVVDTRHVLLWPILYFICGKLPRIDFLRRLVNKKILFVIILVSIIIWQLFVILGNIRIGSDALEFGARQLAMDFDLNPAYWDLSGAAIWAIIYLFGGFARGIDRENELEVFHFDLQEELFPGVLQFIPSALGLHAAVATDRFSQQAMAIDGYHDLCLVYGFLLGSFLFATQILLFIYIIHKITQRLKTSGTVNPVWYALFLWLGVRILLLPIGAYIFAFSGLMEGVFLYLFMYAAKMYIVKKRDAE